MTATVTRPVSVTSIGDVTVTDGRYGHRNRGRKTLPIVIYVVLSVFFSLFSYSDENPLVDVQKIIPGIKIEIRYATDDNFMKEVLYPEARCLLRRETAEKLLNAQKRAEKLGYSLKIFDAYRPLSVQKKMWARFPIKGYVAEPAPAEGGSASGGKGSNHNRGAAVDLTLVDIVGRELLMPSAYDEFSQASHRNYMGGTREQRKNRRLLERLMKKEGFKGLSTEWWHFDDQDAGKYPVLDLPFSSVGNE